MVVKKARFFCKKCKLWFFVVHGKYANEGKCPICTPREVKKKQSGGKRK